MFLFEAYRQIGVSVATLSYYCGPLIVLILAPFVFKEKLTAEKVAGFASVVLGMMLVNGNREAPTASAPAGLPMTEVLAT